MSLAVRDSFYLAFALSLIGAVVGAQAPKMDVQHRIPDGAGFPDASAGAPHNLAAFGLAEARFPTTDPSVSPAVKFRLEGAFEVAVDALRHQPSCSGLFTRLGANGAAALVSTRYFGGGEIGACSTRSVPAFTCVGCEHTTLCATFSRLTTSAAATILIHEALHFAGLKERPAYRGEMSAAEITTMVNRSCRL